MRSLITAVTVALMGFASSPSPENASIAHWTRVHGHALYYETRGSGRPLLLLHGGGASISASFAQQLDAFARGHRIIAPEQIGQGHTPDIDGPLSYTAMMHDTAALLEQLQVRDVDVVGWSDGGIIALMLAVNYPQLVHRVVISGANMSPDGLLDSEIASMRAHSEHGSAEKLRQLWLSAPTRGELNPQLLQQLQQPVLVLAGDHDVIKLDHTQQIYQALPHAQMSVLPNTGHATFEQRAQWVNPLVLEFLAQN